MREDEDVREGARAGRRPKQDEVWREAERGTAVDDANVLWEVRYEDADKYEARINAIRSSLATTAGIQSYRETAKLAELGEDKSSQRVFMAPLRQDKAA